VPSREWEIWLEHNVLIRIHMTTDNQGNVDHFTAQLEVWLEDTWWPVVRYDSAHHEAHGDYINPRGVKYQKDWLNLRWPFNTALTRARQEPKEDYQHHITRFITQLEGRS